MHLSVPLPVTIGVIRLVNLKITDGGHISQSFLEVSGSWHARTRTPTHTRTHPHTARTHTHTHPHAHAPKHTCTITHKRTNAQTHRLHIYHNYNIIITSV